MALFIRKYSCKPFNTKEHVNYIFRSSSKNNWLPRQHFGGFFLITINCLPKWIIFDTTFWKHLVAVIIVSRRITFNQFDYYLFLPCALCCTESKDTNREEYKKKCYGLIQDTSVIIDWTERRPPLKKVARYFKPGPSEIK